MSSKHVEVLERLRGVLEHGKMGDKCLIAPDLVTAAIAALSAPQPPAEAQRCPCGQPTCVEPWEPGCGLGNSDEQVAAEAQPVAKLVNRVDSDGGKTTTFIRPTSLGMDLPLGEYPLHLHPPPRARSGEAAAGCRGSPTRSPSFTRARRYRMLLSKGA